MLLKCCCEEDIISTSTEEKSLAQGLALHAVYKIIAFSFTTSLWDGQVIFTTKQVNRHTEATMHVVIKV